MSSNNAHKNKARAAQKATGESYMRARRSVDHTPAEANIPDDAAAVLALLGLPAGVSARNIAELWSARRLPVGTGEPVERQELLRVPIGVDSSGSPLWLDIKEGSEGGLGPHGLLAGITGAGKSSLLQTISFALCVSHGPELLELVVVDPGGFGDFAGFDGYPHVRLERGNDWVVEAIETRQTALKAAGARSLADYQNLRSQPGGEDLPAMPYMVVVIDGIESLDHDGRRLLGTLWRQGRALGIHALAAAEMPGLAERQELSNVSYRIALKTDSVAMSRAIINTDQAYALPSTPGAGLLHWRRPGAPSAATGFQGFRVSPQTVRGHRPPPR
jgi:S-DNA-T family DNA segregation ATPase FtsK/SpoIIIE